ncbi:MAG: hypothetical protein R3208_00560 [Ketobacteraceae bacterium]|nr:hypothetical protein [Ketobacteraceae bacterium]
MKVAVSRINQIALGLILVAFIGYLFGAGSLFGFCLGLGGLLLVYSGFRRFWTWLERRYSGDQ